MPAVAADTVPDPAHTAAAAAAPGFSSENKMTVPILIILQIEDRKSVV